MHLVAEFNSITVHSKLVFVRLNSLQLVATRNTFKHSRKWLSSLSYIQKFFKNFTLTRRGKQDAVYDWFPFSVDCRRSAKNSLFLYFERCAHAHLCFFILNFLFTLAKIFFQIEFFTQRLQFTPNGDQF